jgi:hypothetical protein
LPVVAENQPERKTAMSLDLIEMAGRVRSFMRWSLGTQDTQEEFNRLAVELCALQRQSNVAYGKFCGTMGRGERWQDIPAVPAAAFKELEMTALTPEERTTVFFSSGTTQGDRSRHFHSTRSLELYEESLCLWFEREFAREKEGVSWLFLTPDAQQAPNSSLVHMFQTIGERVSPDVNRRRARRDAPYQFAGIIDQEGIWDLDARKTFNFLSVAQNANEPVAVFGTAFLFVHLLDALEKEGAKLRLPEGSWVLETGGYKGRTREIPKDELHRLIAERLGVAREKIFGEYGMSELSSQAYAGADGVFRFPPWVRARLISPATGRDADEGERGLIRIYDLANVWSVMAVQTEDVGVRVGDGIRLLGRAKLAEARGCSLMAA